MNEVPQCMKQQQAAGGASPRSCERCGLGPCQVYGECKQLRPEPALYDNRNVCPDGNKCSLHCLVAETCKRVASGKQRQPANYVCTDHINEYCNATIELLAITLYRERHSLGAPSWHTLTHEERQRWRKTAAGVLPIA